MKSDMEFLGKIKVDEKFIHIPLELARRTVRLKSGKGDRLLQKTANVITFIGKMDGRILRKLLK